MSDVTGSKRAGIDPSASCVVALLPVPLHGAAISIPVPHWVVLLAVVPSLWVVIGVGAVAIDRLLRRLES